MIRAIGATSAAAIGSWLALAILFDNAALQQTITLGPLAPERAFVTYVAAGIVAFACGAIGAAGGRAAAVALVILLMLDLAGSAAACLVIGELDLNDVPRVMVVLAALGLQPAGFLAGALVSSRRRLGSRGGPTN